KCETFSQFTSLADGRSQRSQFGLHDSVGSAGEELKILGIVFVKNLAAISHIRSHEFVSSTIMISQFKLTLSQSKMNEWVSNRSRTTHRLGKVIAARNVVSAENIGVSNCC